MSLSLKLTRPRSGLPLRAQTLERHYNAGEIGVSTWPGAAGEIEMIMPNGLDRRRGSRASTDYNPQEPTRLVSIGTPARATVLALPLRDFWPVAHLRPYVRTYREHDPSSRGGRNGVLHFPEDAQWNPVGRLSSSA